MTSTPSAVTLSHSIANLKARRTARGQWGQVGVEKTWMWTGFSSAARAAFVSSREAALAARHVQDGVDQRAELVALGQPVEAQAVVLALAHHRDRRDARDAELRAPWLRPARSCRTRRGGARVECGELLHEPSHLLRLGVGEGLGEHQQAHRILEVLELRLQLGRDLVADERHRCASIASGSCADPSDPARKPGPDSHSQEAREEPRRRDGQRGQEGTKTRKITITAAR